MDSQLELQVRTRAGNRCEYCHMPQSASKLTFPIDHIVARQHGGATASENLALCCGRCNRYKGPNIAGIDSENSQVTRLFHPRQDSWAGHFRYEDATIHGLTSIGRVTVAVLNMNHLQSVAARRALIDSGQRF